MMLPVAHAINGKAEAAGRGAQIGRVNLFEIADCHYFCARPGARYQAVHLRGGEILCFVDKKELVGEAAPPHKARAFDLDPVLQELHS